MRIGEHAHTTPNALIPYRMRTPCLMADSDNRQAKAKGLLVSLEHDYSLVWLSIQMVLSAGLVVRARTLA